ncbi:type VI secretion system protein TssA [Exercitatus varius]|uniref:type VI secretion system protein TssA n=1 Tax=Exercitatus varius TaxID=67857 RepID=UPI00294B60DF|nr:type VI secretion system protein TssA [Exercitatus varius]MDG2942770.1 type VI secretion system protein TssA [Exercitatus varius]
MKYQNILQDITTENRPIGLPDEEGKLFFAIDEQVMKFGSLQHDTIDWDGLITSCVQYLTEVCKDYKVLQYLAYALLQKNARENFIEFLTLFAEFNKKYLFDAYPKPSKNQTVDRFKARAILLVINRIEDAFNKNGENFSHEQNQATAKKLAEISPHLVNYVPDAETIFNKISRKLESQITKSQSDTANIPEQQAQMQSPVTINTGNSPATTQTRAQPGKLNIPDANAFDLTNDRKLKQFYLQVADITCEIDPASILGYISRRYGLWRGITQLPEMNEQGITAMQAIATDKLHDYREFVHSSPSLELLNKIEKTVVSSPYWIEGSYLSAECCRALKLDDAADTIRTVTKRFVDKFDHFERAKFHNGEPFMPEKVAQWLTAADNKTGTVAVNQSAVDFKQIYQEQGFIAVLKAIDDELNAATDIRTRYYLQLDKINYFIHEGITSIALNELETLLKNSKEYAIEDWDNNFFNQLHQLKDQLTRG